MTVRYPLLRAVEEVSLLLRGLGSTGICAPGLCMENCSIVFITSNHSTTIMNTCKHEQIASGRSYCEICTKVIQYELSEAVNHATAPYPLRRTTAADIGFSSGDSASYPNQVERTAEQIYRKPIM